MRNIVLTAAGARDYRYSAPSLPRPHWVGPVTYGGGAADVASFVNLRRTAPARLPADIRSPCSACNQRVRRADARRRSLLVATPRRGILCLRCLQRLSGRCYL